MTEEKKEGAVPAWILGVPVVIGLVFGVGPFGRLRKPLEDAFRDNRTKPAVTPRSPAFGGKPPVPPATRPATKTAPQKPWALW